MTDKDSTTDGDAALDAVKDLLARASIGGVATFKDIFEQLDIISTALQTPTPKQKEFCTVHGCTGCLTISGGRNSIPPVPVDTIAVPRDVLQGLREALNVVLTEYGDDDPEGIAGEITEKINKALASLDAVLSEGK